MPANVTKMFYVGAEPWHHQGIKLPQHLTVAEAFKQATLDWPVHTEQLQRIGPGGRLSSAYAVIREDTDTELGVVTKNWRPIQNLQIANVLQDLVGAKELVVETAGQISGGKKVWMLCKLPGQIAAGKDDLIDKYLAGCVGHDGTLAWHTIVTGVRIVCENTLMSALSSSNGYTVRHTMNASARVEDVRKALGLAHREFEMMEASAVHLAHLSIRPSQVKQFVNELFETQKMEKDKATGLPLIGPRTGAMMEKVTELFEIGRGSELKTAKGTAWGAYNAAVEFVDYYHKTQDRANSVLFGTGAALKRRALKVALSLA